jgi:hypothetical protein
MATLVIAILVVGFAVVSLYDPKLYRKFLAPLCSMREDDLPVFPRTAALALLVFFGCIVLAPAALRTVGSYVWISQRLSNWLVATAFLIVGLALFVSPKVCLKILKWPHAKDPSAVVIARVVGLFLLVGCALFIKSEILHR